MYCPQCGANNDSSARHCNQCGAALFPQVQPPQPPPQVLPPAAYSPPPAGTLFGSAGGAPLPPGTVPNYLVQSILVTLCCCLPLGIVGIIRSGDVNKRLALGDYQGALDVSKSIRTMLWIGFGVGLALTIIYFIVGVFGGLTSSGVFNQ